MEKNYYGRRAYKSLDDALVAHLGLHLNNERKTKFRQLRGKEKENFYFYLTLNCLECQIRYIWLKFEF